MSDNHHAAILILKRKCIIDERRNVASDPQLPVLDQMSYLMIGTGSAQF